MFESNGKATACRYKPIGDQCIFEEIEESSILAMPDGVHPELRRGRVIAAGPGHYELGVLVPMPLKVGDVAFLFDGGNDPPFLELPSDDGRTLVLSRARYIRVLEA